MFGWEFPPFNSGGLGVACLGLTRAMAQEGAKVIFVLPEHVQVELDYMKVVLAKDFPVSPVKFKTIKTLLYPYVTEDGYFEKRMFERDCAYGQDLQGEVLRYAGMAKAIAEKEKFAVIHAHDWLTYLAGIEAKKSTGKPLFVHVHATEFDRTGGGNFNQFVYSIEKFGMEQADGVIAISEYTKNIIIQYYGIDPNKIRVVHNGVEQCPDCVEAIKNNPLEKIKDSGKLLVLSMGRLTLQKGVDYFLKMAKLVSKHVPNAVFIVAGSGDMERALMMQAAKLGISGKVIFTGWLQGSEIQEAYRRADLFVVPSVSEPFGLTVLESMAQGTPVIVSKQSGVSEIIAHALKVDFWDVEEMANKAIAILKYAALNKHLSEESQKEAKELGWDKAAKKCLKFFNEKVEL